MRPGIQPGTKVSVKKIHPNGAVAHMYLTAGGGGDVDWLVVKNGRISRFVHHNGIWHLKLLFSWSAFQLVS
jgi:hypothetical protein